MNGSARTRRRVSRSGLVGIVTVVGGPLVAALVLTGCSGSGSTSVSDAGGGVAAVAPQAKPGEPGGFAQSTTSGAADASGSSGTRSSAGQAGGLILTDRSVIRTAAVSVRVDDVLAASARAAVLAAGAGGFVTAEQTQASPDQPGKAESVITLRVPADRLPQLIDQLRGLGTLLGETQGSEDVTGAVIDVKARIAAQRASVARIQALLARATTIGQVVQIEGELTARQAALESLLGQAAALADQTSLATVTATLVGPKTPVVTETPAPSGFGAGLSRGWHAFTTAGSWLLTAVGAVLPFLLVLLPVAAVAVLIRRRRDVTPVPAPSPAAPADDLDLSGAPRGVS